MENAKITIKDLNLFFGKQHILKNINVEIPENKITVIMGPSGCGKTTLMKSMNRLTDLNPDVKLTGSIIIDGKDILHSSDDITKIRKMLGLLAQRPYPLPMNIYNNIAYGFAHQWEEKKTVPRQAHRALSEAGKFVG